MSYILTTPREANDLIARLFLADSKLRLEAREDRAFKDAGWFELGDIHLDRGEGRDKHLRASVQRGAFEWCLPSLEAATAQLSKLLGLKSDDNDIAKLRRALDAVAAISLRAGL